MRRCIESAAASDALDTVVSSLEQLLSTAYPLVVRHGGSAPSPYRGMNTRVTGSARALGFSGWRNQTLRPAHDGTRWNAPVVEHQHGTARQEHLRCPDK